MIEMNYQDLSKDQLIEKINQLNTKIDSLCSIQQNEKLADDIGFRLSAIVESSEDAIIAVDFDTGVILTWNKGARNIFGYEFQDVKNKHITFLFPEKSDEVLAEIRKKLNKGEALERYKAIGTKGNGELINVSLTMSPILNREGEMKAVSMIARNITERLIYEEELKISEQKFRKASRQMSSIIEFLPDPTFVLNKNREVIAWNKALEEITGVEKTKLLGKNNYEYGKVIYGLKRPIIVDLIWEDNEDFRSEYNYIRQEGNVIFAETIIKNIRDKKSVHVWIAASPIYDENGDLIGAIESFRNVSEWREMEDKLLQAKRMETIAQLSAGVAHEVRNPLNSIMALVEVLNQELEDKDDFGIFLEQINMQVHRLASLMEDLLDLGKSSRAESFSSTTVKQVCNEGINLWEDSPGGAQGKVNLDILDNLDDEMINIDTSRFPQIIINLLDNAAQHSPENSTISIKVSKKFSGREILFRFIDCGTGIPPENMKKILEPFFTMRKKGTGLGLSIVNNIVKDHGGAMNIYNNDSGIGCTVEFTLPYAINLEVK